MATRHADRRHRSQLQSPIDRLAVSVFAAYCLPCRITCGDEFFQDSTVPLGQRSHSDRYETFAAHYAKQDSSEGQDRGIFSSDREHLLSADDHLVAADVAGDDRA